MKQAYDPIKALICFKWMLCAYDSVNIIEYILWSVCFYCGVSISLSLRLPDRQARELRRVVWEPLRGVRQGGLPVFLQGLPLFQSHRGPQLLCRVPEPAVAVRYVAGHHWRPPPRPPRPHSQRWTTRGPAGRVHQTQKALRPLPGGQGTARIPHAASCRFLLGHSQVMNGVGV